jgi:hypothetical protein
MTDPADNEEGFMHWCGSHAPSPYSDPSCIRTGSLFRGYVDSPNIPITIEGKVPDPSALNPWFKVGVVMSDSKGPPYEWGKWLALDYNMWEVAQGTTPATVKNSASVRSASPTTPLASLISDRYNCYLAHSTAFLANCGSPVSPAARIVAVQDFGQDCVNLVNMIRSIEGVASELKEYDQEESLADQDAAYNYVHGPHSSTHGQGWNETDTYDSYDQILDIAIWLHMYVYEKQYHYTGTCAEPAVCHTDGHYLHLIGTQFTKLACGIYVTPDKKFHAVQNFYW